MGPLEQTHKDLSLLALGGPLEQTSLGRWGPQSYQGLKGVLGPLEQTEYSFVLN